VPRLGYASAAILLATAAANREFEREVREEQAFRSRRIKNRIHFNWRGR